MLEGLGFWSAGDGSHVECDQLEACRNRREEKDMSGGRREGGTGNASSVTQITLITRLVNHVTRHKRDWWKQACDEKEGSERTSKNGMLMRPVRVLRKTSFSSTSVLSSVFSVRGTGCKVR
jgi:hypothetical protein